MNFKQFEYMYNQSADMKNRVNAWLIKHPPPSDVHPLKWACNAFVRQKVGEELQKQQAHKDVYDPSRFHVTKDEILAEAIGRRELGEDAGAAYNESQGRHRQVKPVMLKNKNRLGSDGLKDGKL